MEQLMMRTVDNVRRITFALLAGQLLHSPLFAQFGTVQPIGHAQMGTSPTELVDLDGDGDRDLVFLADNSISWMPNSGTGSFWPRRMAVDDIQYLKVMDLDQDGDLDLIGVRDEVMVWAANTGGGRFPAPVVEVGACPSFSDIGYGDMDGDEDVDLFYTSFTTGVLAWFANDGSHHFGPAQVISNVAAAYTCRAFDLDLDGDLDPLTTIASYSVWIPNNGNGTFAAPVQLAISNAAYQFEHVDIDNDQDADIVTMSRLNGSAGGVSWYAQESPGVYGTRQEISAWGMKHMSFRDFDLDGDLDMMGLRGDLMRKHTNDGSGVFTVGTIIEGTVNCFMALCEDLNNDGAMDVVGLHGGDELPVRALTKFGDHSGNFGAGTHIGWKQDTDIKVHMGDLNGDGHEDVLALHTDNEKLSWYPGLGNGGYGLEKIITVQSTTGAYTYYMYQEVSIADMDGDGDQDIVLAVYNGTENVVVLVNNGSGEFTAGMDLLLNVSNPWSVTTVDIEGDGDQDVLSRYDQSGIGLSINNGTGQFSAPVNVTDQPSNEVVHGDLDDDGDVDLALNYASSITLLENTGSGWITYATVASPFTAERMVLHDLNADGFDDLLHITGAVVRCHMNDGNGGVVRIDLPDSAAMEVAVGDIDLDGKPDLVYGATNALRWLRNTGGGIFEPGIIISATNGAYDRVRLSDVDADGDLDVITSSVEKGLIALYENYTLAPCIIHGTIFLDTDEDGVLDVGEDSLPLLPVHLTPAAPALYTDGSGAYEAHVEPGTYSADLLGLAPLWTATTPVPLTTTLTVQDNLQNGFDIGIVATVDTTIIATELVLGSAPCGSTSSLWLALRNAGTRVEEGSVMLALDDRFGFLSSTPPPTTATAELITWDFADLALFQQRTITVQVLQPAVEFIDSTWTHLLTVSTLGQSTGLFLDTLQGVVTCSYDPNDKQVQPVGYGAHGAVPTSTEELQYTIRFQNTGTAPATDVELRDLLDGRIDPSSVRLTASSHPISTLQVDEDGELHALFAGIMLPDSGADFAASQGFIRFLCSTRITPLAHLTRIENDAAIHFDLNAPVITNTTVNTWVDCSLWQPVITTTSANMLVATDGESYQWYLDDEPLAGATARLITALDDGSYTVDVRDAYGCERRSAVYAHIASGVGHADRYAARVMPNPFLGQFTIRMSEDLPEHVTIRLMDQQGRQLDLRTSRYGNELIVYRGSLAAGLYTVLIQHEGQVLSSMRVVAE
ncbi:MAG: VCBS repeat-containing protein [Flavobacteriales bacterium]|nr:VCBS repeat-containing protein [Flavobacteriales bacterium]